MNFDLKIGKAVQLLLLGVVCLGGYALIADTHNQINKEASEIHRQADEINAPLCAHMKKLGTDLEGCS